MGALFRSMLLLAAWETLQCGSPTGKQAEWLKTAHEEVFLYYEKVWLKTLEKFENTDGVDNMMLSTLADTYCTPKMTGNPFFDKLHGNGKRMYIGLWLRIDAMKKKSVERYRHSQNDEQS